MKWRKSSRSSSNGGNCVELARTLHDVAARDSKNPTKGTLRISRNAFATLLADIKSGTHDR